MKKHLKKYIIIIIFAVLAIAITGFILLNIRNRNRQAEESVSYEEITMVLPTYGYVPENIDSITEALNRISMEKCGVRVNYLYTGSTELNQSLLLRLKAGEVIDLMPCLEENGLVTLMNENLLTPLGELIHTHAPQIETLFYSKIWEALGRDGEIYALSAIGSQSDWGGILFTGEVLNAGGITADSITSEIRESSGNDVERVDTVISPVLYRLKESETQLPDGSYVSEKQLAPGIYDYGGIFSQLPVIHYCGYGNSLGVVMDGTDQVINLYETQEYRQELELLKRWNDAGYIYHINTLIDEDPATVYGGRDRIGLFTSLGVKVDRPYEVIEMGNDLYFPFIRNKLTTDKFRIGTWAIPRTSLHPEAAMKILNLMYTDEEYVRTYNFGPEFVETNEMPLVWLFGNTLLTEKTFEESLKEQEDYKNVEFADYFGFTYDSAAYQDEIAALQAVLDEYMPDLENGIIGDVEKTLEEMNGKLYDAGLQSVMQDKQMQLDQWIADHAE